LRALITANLNRLAADFDFNGIPIELQSQAAQVFSTIASLSNTRKPGGQQ
jgi:hypothetical protein